MRKSANFRIEQNVLPTNRKRTEALSVLFCVLIWYKLHLQKCFFAFKIKFRKTKQIVVTFALATHKALFTVSKTKVRLPSKALHG